LIYKDYWTFDEKGALRNQRVRGGITILKHTNPPFDRCKDFQSMLQYGACLSRLSCCFKPLEALYSLDAHELCYARYESWL
jgi:hypothetical protein